MMFFMKTCIRCGKNLLTGARSKSYTSYDPYKVLGISHDSSEGTIKNTYFRLAKEFHPDKNPDSETAKEKFIQIQNAYRFIMEKIAANQESASDGSGGMPYSFTIDPLGVEDHPPPTAMERNDVKVFLKFGLLLGITIAVLLFRPIRDENDEDVAAKEEIQQKEDIEHYRKYVSFQQEKAKQLNEVGGDMNQVVKSLAVSR